MAKIVLGLFKATSVQFGNWWTDGAAVTADPSPLLTVSMNGSEVQNYCVADATRIVRV
jgi:hypothetical protein